MEQLALAGQRGILVLLVDFSPINLSFNLPVRGTPPPSPEQMLSFDWKQKRGPCKD